MCGANPWTYKQLCVQRGRGLSGRLHGRAGRAAWSRIELVSPRVYVPRTLFLLGALSREHLEVDCRDLRDEDRHGDDPDHLKQHCDQHQRGASQLQVAQCALYLSAELLFVHRGAAFRRGAAEEGEEPSVEPPPQEAIHAHDGHDAPQVDEDVDDGTNE